MPGRRRAVPIRKVAPLANVMRSGSRPNRSVANMRPQPISRPRTRIGDAARLEFRVMAIPGAASRDRSAVVDLARLDPADRKSLTEAVRVMRAILADAPQGR